MVFKAMMVKALFFALFIVTYAATGQAQSTGNPYHFRLLGGPDSVKLEELQSVIDSVRLFSDSLQAIHGDSSYQLCSFIMVIIPKNGLSAAYSCNNKLSAQAISALANVTAGDKIMFVEVKVRASVMNRGGFSSSVITVTE